MRVWRKIESGILTSERLAAVSDSARWLFVLLLVAQDDEGKYPWTPTMVRALTVTTKWDSAASDSLLSELRESGVAELREGFAVLRHGAKKNGTPANSKRWVMLYPPVSDPYGDSEPPRNRLTTEAVPTVQSRVEKSREEIPPLVPPLKGGTPTRKGKQPIPMNGDERQKLYEVFASTWTVEEINQRVEEALNHVAASRVKSQYLYVRGWLRRDRERLSVGGRAPLKVGRDGKPFTSFDNSLEKFIDLQKHDTQIGREESDATARDRIAADKIQHMDRPA